MPCLEVVDGVLQRRHEAHVGVQDLSTEIFKKNRHIMRVTIYFFAHHQRRACSPRYTGIQRNEREVVAGDLVADVAVYEHGARALAHELVGGHARVRAPDPQVPATRRKGE